MKAGTEILEGLPTGRQVHQKDPTARQRAESGIVRDERKNNFEIKNFSLRVKTVLAAYKPV